MAAIPGSRICDPNDPKRIFIWLIDESREEKGNAILYEYAAEDEARTDRSALHEQNRLYSANRYWKRIKYDNRTPHYLLSDQDQTQWLFEAVFDYDEGHYEEIDPAPSIPDTDKHQYAYASLSPGSQWAARPTHSHTSLRSCSE